MFKEVIIVEGRDDTRRLKEIYPKIETFETGGSAIDAQKIIQIKYLQHTRGVIIFTDPDYPGQKIRQTISQEVPNCKHAYLAKNDARPKSGKGLGVEHATKEAIMQALATAMTPSQQSKTQISESFLTKHDLIGHPGSKKKRELLAKKLGIGYVNGKQLKNRLNLFDISEKQILKALEKEV